MCHSKGSKFSIVMETAMVLSRVSADFTPDIGPSDSRLV